MSDNADRVAELARIHAQRRALAEERQTLDLGLDVQRCVEIDAEIAGLKQQEALILRRIP